MTERTSLVSNCSSSGVTLTEYAILIALIAGLSVIGLKLLGNSTSDLFIGTSKSLEASTIAAVASAASPTNSSDSENSQWISKPTSKENYQITTDPVTGQPLLELVPTGGSGTNVSSSDGMQKTLGTFMVAETLTKMANAEKDPYAQSYYSKLAELTYYLGGTEGVMENIDSLQVSEEVTIGKNKKAEEIEAPYTPQNALSDLMTYQNELEALLSSPPLGVSKEAVNKVTPLVKSSLEIADSYIENNQDFIQETKKGDIIVDASINEVLGAELSELSTYGNGKNKGKGNSNGKAKGKGKIKSMPTASQSYHNLVSVDKLRDIAQSMVIDSQVSSTPVETTLENAVKIDPVLTPPAP